MRLPYSGTTTGTGIASVLPVDLAVAVVGSGSVALPPCRVRRQYRVLRQCRVRGSVTVAVSDWVTVPGFAPTPRRASAF